MAVTADKGEDKGKESRTTEQLRVANAASWHPDDKFAAPDRARPSNFGPTEPRAAALPPGRSPAAASARAR